jgi:hypothetical protein
MHFAVAAGYGEVSRGCGVEGQVGEAVSGEVVLYFFGLVRDNLAELEYSSGHGAFGLLAQLSATIRNTRGTLRHR